MIASREDELLLSQKRILESVALGRGFQETLDELCDASELIVPGALCSIMTLDPLGKYLSVIAAPHIPRPVIDRLNGLAPGKAAGSCGAAVLSNAPVYVGDTLVDERWRDLRQLAVDFDIRACWSHPIRNTQRRVVGSFALSSFEVREPSYFQQQLLSESANIAGIIIERHSRERDLWDKAHQDKLTGLYNRLMFDMSLERAISNARRNQSQLAILFIDLDNFKIVNDTYGHKAGDDVLLEIARRLKSCQRNNDTLARYGGDEFALLLENIEDINSVTQVAQRVIDECAQPISSDGYSARVSASVGISLYPNDAITPRVLLSYADRAMYKAKSKGRNGLYFYEEGLSRVVEAKKRLAVELRSALVNNEFVLFYQPQLATDGTMFSSVETLVRWDHPQRGLLTPDDFLPMIEEEGLMGELSEWVLRSACTQGKRWLDSGFQLDRITINFSLCAGQVASRELVRQVLDETGFPATCLELDFAESLVAEEGDALITELDLLKKQGIKIALDDFGAGGVSLVLLARLPIDLLKMDKVLVERLMTDSGDIRLIKTVMAMAKSLDLPVLAKRVETDVQRDILIREGCSYLQGYLFSKPLPSGEVEKILLRC